MAKPAAVSDMTIARAHRVIGVVNLDPRPRTALATPAESIRRLETRGPALA